MTRIIAVVLIGILIALAAGTAGCTTVVSGSGETATWEMAYTAFNRLEISSGFEVTLTRTDSHAVSITVDKNLYEHLKIAQRGDTLYLGLKPGRIYEDAVRRASISLPELRRLEVSGGSSVTLSGFSVGYPVDFIVSGSSKLDFGQTAVSNTTINISGASTAYGNLQATKVGLDISGKSSLRLTGKAESMTLVVSGVSSADLANFATVTASVDLSSISQ
ncbi:MAG: DUF2807 domain-containing protein, partial [Dehalococcoidales bacterium]|nr:DUF2807 domain-containing protein [Dehalococcoidales bacterium]